MDRYEKYLVELPRYSELGPGAFKPGQERVLALSNRLGNPHVGLPVVHVAGTNGKGTTASLVASMFTAHGYDVGLFTSPHISSVRERFRINGQPIPGAELGRLTDRLRPALEEVQPSFFEAMTALAFSYFAEEDVDLAVIEVGLGGRLDATNIVEPLLSVITAIGYDHVSTLGSTLPLIAREKAGIVKTGVPVVTCAIGEALEVIRQVAESQQADLVAVGEDTRFEINGVSLESTNLDIKTRESEYRGVTLGVPGRHQAMNAATAVSAVECLSRSHPVSAYSIREGLLNVQRHAGIRGRLELVRTRPAVVVDVAHNPEGILAGLAHLREALPDANISVCLGIMSDKDIEEVISVISSHASTMYAVALPSPRAANAELLVDTALRYGLKVPTESNFQNVVADFVRSGSQTDVLLITGSHQTAEMAYARDMEHLISEDLL